MYLIGISTILFLAYVHFQEKPPDKFLKINNLLEEE